MPVLSTQKKCTAFTFYAKMELKTWSGSGYAKKPIYSINVNKNIRFTSQPWAQLNMLSNMIFTEFGLLPNDFTSSYNYYLFFMNRMPRARIFGLINNQRDSKNMVTVDSLIKILISPYLTYYKVHTYKVHCTHQFIYSNLSFISGDVNSVF